MNEPSVITKNPYTGRYVIKTAPRFGIPYLNATRTLWGARLTAKWQQRKAARCEKDRVFREVIQPNCRSTQPKDKP